MSGSDKGARNAPTNEGATPEQEQPKTHPDTESAVSAPIYVLIAEDEEPIAEALAFLVEDCGYTPLHAVHGAQALQLARQMRPRLVITDLMMPVMDGAELIAAIRADAASDHSTPPPIILTTAGGFRRAQEAGADLVVRKPFDVDDIEALLHRFLGPPPERS